jgi:opacity protein-like surface antigen
VRLTVRHCKQYSFVSNNYKMKKLIFAITTMLLIKLTAFAQLDIGFKGNVGLSYLKTKLDTTGSVHFVGGGFANDKNYFRPSGQFGFFFNLNSLRKFSLGTELLFIQIEGKETIGNMDSLSGIENKNKVWRHISYIGIPFYLCYNIKKIKINVGFQINYTILSGARDQGQGFFLGHFSSWDNRLDHLEIERCDYGPRVGLTYKLSDEFLLEANGYYGLNNIVKDKILSSALTWEIRQITVGLRYKFISYYHHKDVK